MVVGVVIVTMVLGTPVEGAVSRRVEAAADWRALELTGDPAASRQLTVELAETNLSRPEPPAWRHRWWGTHPTPLERLTMDARFEERAGRARRRGRTGARPRAYRETRGPARR
jgi:STE24 endopeptidase